MSKRKKPAPREDRAPAEPLDVTDQGEVTAAAAPEEEPETPRLESDPPSHVTDAPPESERALLEAMVASDVDAEAAHGDEPDAALSERDHTRGLLEALIFASDAPIVTKELARLSSTPVKLVLELLSELRREYRARGINLAEIAGGWVFRTNARYAHFVRDLTKQRPVKLSRAQVEALAIIAYRQPVTRPEIDDVRGVDSGPVLKVLLERDLVRILGKREEPGRPLIYGTTTNFLEFFGLKSLKDLPTLREFTELTEESRETYEDELGEPFSGSAAARTDRATPPRDLVDDEDLPTALDRELREADQSDSTPPEEPSDDDDALDEDDD